MCCDPKCCIYIISLITIAEALVHLMTIIDFSKNSGCKLSPASNLANVYVTYFYDSEKCKEKYLNVFLHQSIKLEHYIKMPSKSRWYENSHRLIRVYFIFNILSIGSTICLYTSTHFYSKRKEILAFYSFWLGIHMPIFALDTLATGFYLSHYLSIHKPSDWLNIIGISNDQDVNEDFNKNVPINYAYNAPATMSIVFGRLVVFYFINFLCLYRMLKNTYAEYMKYQEKEKIIEAV